MRLGIKMPSLLAFIFMKINEKQFAVLRVVINDIMANELDDIDEYSTLGQFYADIHNLNETLSDVEDRLRRKRN